MSNEYKDWQRDNAVDAKIAEVKSLRHQLALARQEIEKMKDFIADCPHLPQCYRKRMHEKAKGIEWQDLPCICGRDEALKDQVNDR